MTEYPTAGEHSQTGSTLLCDCFYLPASPPPAGYIDATNRLLPIHSVVRFPDHATANATRRTSVAEG